jgi:uncharacterized membrane protein
MTYIDGARAETLTWKKHESLSIVLYSLILLLFLVPVCTAQETEATPGITYLIQFQELNEETVNRFKVNFMVEDKNKVPSGGWQVISGEEVSRFNWEKPVTVDLVYSGGFKENYFQGYYFAQLTTLENETVSARIGETIIEILANDIYREDLFLEISLTPEEVDFETGRVLTSFELKHTSREGIIINETTNWVGVDFQEPLVVISREIKSNQGSDRKYFALYLAVLINNQDMLKGRTILSAGNIQGFNRLFLDSFSSLPDTEYLLEFKLANRKTAFKVTGDSGIIRYYLGVEKLGQAINYQAGFDYALYYNEDLFWTVLLNKEGVTGQAPVFWLGFTDQVQWFNLLNLKITYLPIGFDMIKGNFLQNSLTTVRMELPINQWSLGYSGQFSKYFSSNYLSLGYDLSEEWELELGYSDSSARDGSFSIGINWQP